MTQRIALQQAPQSFVPCHSLYVAHFVNKESVSQCPPTSNWSFCSLQGLRIQILLKYLMHLAFVRVIKATRAHTVTNHHSREHIWTLSKATSPTNWYLKYAGGGSNLNGSKGEIQSRMIAPTHIYRRPVIQCN
jgi:hypothetical protein